MTNVTVLIARKFAHSCGEIPNGNGGTILYFERFHYLLSTLSSFSEHLHDLYHQFLSSEHSRNL